MKKDIWFKAKRYGYGWYPCTWQGWLMIALYFIVVFGNFFLIDKYAESAKDVLSIFLPITVVSTIILVILAYLKGEKAKWRWG